MKAVIVLPTYNEKENIQIIVPQLIKEFEKIKHDMHILVVDDTSPDGTALEVKKMQKKYKNLHLLMGDKQGLGVAYLRGFDHAIKKLKADVMFCMDSDLSHPAKMVPDFMKGIDEGYDLIIGSRYISGGGTPDWGPKRKIISAGGNFFARMVSGMYHVHDCTSGFRAIRTKVFKSINIENLHTRGYAFLSTLLYELIAHGAKVKEIPLVFYDRLHGETKLRTNDMIEFFVNAFRLRLRSSKRFIKFGMVGGSGIIVNLGMLFVLVEVFGLSKILLAPILAVEASIIWNFMLNNFWTFKHSKNTDHFLKKLMKFHLIAFSGMALNLAIYNAVLFMVPLHTVFGRYDYLPAQFVAICFVFLWNYFVNSRWTWRE